MLAVVINEIHYDPHLNTEQVEFIELYNSGQETVNLSNWRIDEAVDFVFAPGSEIAADGFLVVTQNAADFQAKFGFAPFGQWEVGDRLANEGETIELRDAADQLVDVVTYQPGFPWPTTGEFGSSLELINPVFDNDLAGNWRSSGLTDPDPASGTLVESGSIWRYRKGISQNPPANWRLSNFNEATDPVMWQDGVASIGYGDGDDATVLNDMRNNYTSIYLRKQFTIDGTIPNTLLLRVYVDDGAIISINGTEVSRLHASGGIKNFNSTSGGTVDEAMWEEVLLTNAASYLVSGDNTITVHVLNSQINSSDLSFNLELSVPTGIVTQPTPGAVNSVFASNAAPQMRQLRQSVDQPTSGEDVIVRVKVTDPDAVQDVVLEYQAVDPGSYIRLTDAAYETNWVTLMMHDDGLEGDEVAGDDVYSVVLPGSLQVHRRLIRYRITATDSLGASIRAPYADDPQPNFAYFVYDGVPDYTASFRPGVLPSVTYSGDMLDDIATYHLIANGQDVENSQYNPSFNEVLFRGTFVYNGVVYDHVQFRNRGVASTYQVGKNKWKIEFLHGHHLEAHDNYGRPYKESLDEINILPGTNPWWRNNVSTDGTVLFEPVAFRLYELAGAPAPNTNYFQFRVIDGASEFGINQYAGDFWGLYISIEQPDGSLLDERGLPDGNVYNMHGGAFGSTNQRHQGSDLPTDRSDLVAFLAGIDGGFESLEWWEENLHWDSYFAWNIINHVVNNSDIRPNENVNYYHNQETGQWYTIPWDLDLTFEDAPHFTTPVTERENIRALLRDHPQARLAYENRLREVTDLLLDNGDAALVVKELASVLTFGGSDQTIVDANQAQWDYHPRKTKPGIWYKNFNPGLMPSEDFAGMVTYIQNFVSSGGYGYELLVGQGDDTLAPFQPTISYVGEPGFAIDQLAFETTPFNDPQGAGTFAAIEWRVAEVYNSEVDNYTGGPFIYEIEGTWESGRLTTFDSQMTIPQEDLDAGRTYRARVRMQDNTGRWSHWSDPIQFLAAPNPTSLTLAIAEVHYHPADDPDLTDPDDLEFIEVVNYGNETVSLAGVQLTEFISPEVYTFDSSLTLDPGQRIVVARDPVVFQSVYGTRINLAPTGFKFDGKNLSNSGERIVMLGPLGETLQDFTYSDDPPWPTAADGDGRSMELIDPLSNPNNPANWRASLADGGSPGTDGVTHTELPGDYDGNGTVEQADYNLWRSVFGVAVAPYTSADGNGNGIIDSSDFVIWRNHLGSSMAAAAAETITVSWEASQSAREAEEHTSGLIAMPIPMVRQSPRVVKVTAEPSPTLNNDDLRTLLAAQRAVGPVVPAATSVEARELVFTELGQPTWRPPLDGSPLLTGLVATLQREPVLPLNI